MSRKRKSKGFLRGFLRAVLATAPRKPSLIALTIKPKRPSGKRRRSVPKGI